MRRRVRVQPRSPEMHQVLHVRDRLQAVAGDSAGTIKLRRVYETTTGVFPSVTRTFHSVACQHCPDAPCIERLPARSHQQGGTPTAL